MTKSTSTYFLTYDLYRHFASASVCVCVHFHSCMHERWSVAKVLHIDDIKLYCCHFNSPFSIQYKLLYHLAIALNITNMQFRWAKIQQEMNSVMLVLFNFLDISHLAKLMLLVVGRKKTGKNDHPRRSIEHDETHRQRYTNTIYQKHAD